MAIAKTTTAVKTAIANKTAQSLPDSPTAAGYTAATIKQRFYQPIIDATNSIQTELDRIVDAINAEFSALTDGTTDIAYDNSTSGLTADTVQAALDELDGVIDDIIDGTQDITYDHSVSGLIAVTVKAALDEIDGIVDDIIDGTQVVASATKATNDANGDAIHSTYEKLANKKTTLTDNSDTYYPTQKAVKTAVDLKADKATTIIGIDLQNDILLTEFKTALGNATTLLAGLMSATDKSRLDALHALLGTEADADAVVNTINEVLAIFATYPEGADIVTALAGKVDKVAGMGLSTNDYTDAEQAKVSHIPDNFTTYMGDYYTKSQVDTLLDQLKTAYGLTETAFDELAHNDTIALSTLTGYDFITLDLKHSDTHFVFDGKRIDPALFTNNGDLIQLNAFEGVTQHSYGALTYDGTTNLTFTASDTSDTLVIKGYKKDAVTGLLVKMAHSGTNFLDLSGNAKEDVETLDDVAYKNEQEIRKIGEETITYRDDGKVSSVVADTVTTTPTYDEYGNITKITEVYALDSKTYETTVSYDKFGRISGTNKVEV